MLELILLNLKKGGVLQKNTEMREQIYSFAVHRMSSQRESLPDSTSNLVRCGLPGLSINNLAVG